VNVESIAVVIPAHDEETLLPAALTAVETASRHPELAGVRVLTVVVADSCRDRTAEVAHRAGVLVLRARCRNPGRARAEGTERALRELGTPPAAIWVAATDADSAVPPDWLAHHRARAREGWDAVVGTVELAPQLPPLYALAAGHLRRYEAGRPLDGSVWHHPHVHGANLGVSAAAYLDAGGFPPLDVAEDHALVTALEHRGHRVLRTSQCPVLTSGRLRGRATGGFADYLARLADDQGAAG
jgi:glycosyltransferase involved in cell wall biosynthesis